MSKNEEAKLRNLLDDTEGSGGDIGDIPVVEDVGIIPTALAEEQRHRRRRRHPDRRRRRRRRGVRRSHWSETFAGEGWFSGCESSGGAGSCDHGEEAGMSEVGEGVLGWRWANSGLWEVFFIFLKFHGDGDWEWAPPALSVPFRKCQYCPKTIKNDKKVIIF